MRLILWLSVLGLIACQSTGAPKVRCHGRLEPINPPTEEAHHSSTSDTTARSPKP